MQWMKRLKSLSSFLHLKLTFSCDSGYLYIQAIGYVVLLVISFVMVRCMASRGLPHPKLSSIPRGTDHSEVYT